VSQSRQLLDGEANEEEPMNKASGDPAKVRSWMSSPARIIKAARYRGPCANEHGSELDVTVKADGRLRSTFRTGVGFPQAEDKFEVVSFAAGELLSFVVSFSPRGLDQLLFGSTAERILRGASRAALCVP
jgi:hypothetical protein